MKQKVGGRLLMRDWKAGRDTSSQKTKPEVRKIDIRHMGFSVLGFWSTLSIFRGSETSQVSDSHIGASLDLYN